MKNKRQPKKGRGKKVVTKRQQIALWMTIESIAFGIPGSIGLLPKLQNAKTSTAKLEDVSYQKDGIVLSFLAVGTLLVSCLKRANKSSLLCRFR